MAMLDMVRDELIAKAARLEEIDSMLDPATASKTKVLNEATRRNQELVDNAVAEFNAKFSSLNAEQIAVIATAVRKALKAHQNTVDAYVKENTPENGEAPKLDAEVVAALNAERTKVVLEAKAARSFVIQLDPSQADSLPKITARAKGTKRTGGPRLKGTYNFSVDGEPVDGHTLSAVKTALEAESVAAVRKAIAEQNGGEEIWGAERERIEFTFEGKKVVGKLTQSDSGEDDSVDEDEDDDTSDDEDDLFN